MAEGFMQSFVDWLRKATSHRIVWVDGPKTLEPGTFYLPTDDRHLEFCSPRRITISDDPPRGFQRPSADVLFESGAKYFKDTAIGLILTGMGSDGAEGMLALKKAGSYTLAQTPESCVVESMPQEAVKIGAVEKVLSPEAIGRGLSRLLGSRS